MQTEVNWRHKAKIRRIIGRNEKERKGVGGGVEGSHDIERCSDMYLECPLVHHSLIKTDS